MARPRFELPDTGLFTEDPNTSHTLPGRYYFDPDIYALELDRILYRSWQYVCHVSELSNTGDFFVRDIGDQSVFAVRDRTGTLRAFHNVCQHRAHRLLEGSGRVGGNIVCPYHNWAYGLGGELQRARHSEDVEDFDTSAICLSAVRVELFCGFVFVNLDAAAEPLMNGLEAFAGEVRSLSPDIDSLELADRREIPVAANWKNSVENYSECYHCPNQHPTLANGSLDMDSYQITVHEKYHSHASRGVGEATQYARPLGSNGDTREFGSWMLWPNWCLEVYPGGYLNVFHHLPVGPERTVQICEWYFPNSTPTEAQREVIDFVNVVRDEDIPLVESVQRGLHSRGYSQGRLIANRDRAYYSEHAVHDFQKKVLHALTA